MDIKISKLNIFSKVVSDDANMYTDTGMSSLNSYKIHARSQLVKQIFKKKTIY